MIDKGVSAMLDRFLASRGETSMPEITDIKKLRPELLEMSVSEIDRRIAELEMAKEEKKKQEEAEYRAILIEQAEEAIDRVLSGLRFLHENKFLADNVASFFSTEKGVFMPHLRLKKPRS